MVNIHVYPSPLTHESRILRITDALAKEGLFSEIEVIGLAQEGLPAKHALDERRSLVRLPRKLFPRRAGFLAKVVRTIEWSGRVLNSLRGRQVKCINAHSLAVLPLCVLASRIYGAELVYDTHELETETTVYRGLRQKLARFVEAGLIRKCSKVFVVSDSIADWYAKTYGIPRPYVVRNIPQLPDNVTADKAAVRKAIGLSPDRIAFIYQGGFIAGRGMERLLRIFANLPQLDLVCMGSGPLEPLVRQAAVSSPNIYLLPPVAPHEVLSFSQAADVGICLTDDSCLSHFYSLPNKVFEYLHAGIPIIVNPLLEQERIIREYECGWVAEADDTEFSRELLLIDDAAIATRREGVKSACRAFDWNKEAERLVMAYRTPAQ